MKVWQRTVSWIVSWRIALLVLAGAAANFLPFVKSFTLQGIYGDKLPYISWVWGNFDGAVFLLISQSGYSAEQLPFFPLLPLLAAIVSRIFGFPHIISGLLVSTATFLGALFFIYRLLMFDKKASLFWLLLLILLAFPTSFFYTAMYADSLFLFLATGLLFFARKRNWLLASIFGGLASLARLNGIALFAVIGAEYILSIEPKLEKKWDVRLFFQTVIQVFDLRRLWKSGVLWAILIPGAFLGYLAYIQIAFGDWHLFFSGVEVWHRDKLTFPLQTFWRYCKILFLYPNFTFTYVVAFLEALFTGLYVLSLIWSWGKIRISYWLMIFFHLLIPTMTGTLQGMPRYGLHLYPLFLIYAMFLQDKPRWVRAIWFTVSAGLLVFFLLYYTRGYFVA